MQHEDKKNCGKIFIVSVWINKHHVLNAMNDKAITNCCQFVNQRVFFHSKEIGDEQIKEIYEICLYKVN